MRFLKQSTSVDLPVGPFVDNADGNTPETGLTITQPDIRLKKNGGAWAQKNAAQTLSHEEAGWYEVTLDATDTDTVGQLMLNIHESGALPVFCEFMVLAANTYDTLVGTDTLDVTVTALAANVITAASLASDAGGEIADAVWDEAVSGHVASGSFGATDAAIKAVTDALPNAGALTTIQADIDDIQTRIPAALVGGRMDASIGAVAANAITAAGLDPDVTTELQAGLATSTSITLLGLDVAAIQTDVNSLSTAVSNVQTDTNDIQTRLPAALVSGRMDSSTGEMQTDTITADALASDAVTEIADGSCCPIVTGTADSGSTTTMVDAARTEGDNDYWKGALILFTSGTIAGQSRLITGFVAGTDTITFAPATTQAVSTETYEIHKWARVDVELWDGSAVNALSSGRVDVAVGAMAADVVTASAIAADAIGSSELAASAATEIADALLNRDMSAVSDTNARSPLNALRFLRNKWSISGGTLTVKEEDDTTTAWTAALSTDAAAEPIISSDPG